jgi:hypothetical protein
MPNTYKRFLLFCLLGILTNSLFSQTINDSIFKNLALRFRPYLKFSVYKNSDDIYKPCSWKWLYSNSNLKYNNHIYLCDTNLYYNNHILKLSDIRNLEKIDTISNFKVYPKNVSVYYGENWEKVQKDGQGLYCHVSFIDSIHLSIEYWMLYAFNKSTKQRYDHVGDITSIQMIYNKSEARITDIAYVMHGKIIEMFNLTNPTKSVMEVLTGKNIYTDKNSQIQAEKMYIAKRAIYKNGPFWYHHSRNELYFIKDSTNQKFEHPVIFVEWGAHEPWPNPKGKAWYAPGHNGKSYSFLPDKVKLLDGQDSSFVFFGGIIGENPVALMRHNFWLNTNPNIVIPRKYKSDRNPYTIYLEKGIIKNPK